MSRNLLNLTAADLMTGDVVRLMQDMPVRRAVQLLLRNQVSGAPVVDAEGRCVGVFSAADLLHLAEQRTEVNKLLAPPLPMTCSFQTKHQRPDGSEAILCTLPAGVCPIQVTEPAAHGKELLVCSQPRCVLTDWQLVDLEKLPGEAVRQFMTSNPVMVRPTASIRVLARIMLDAHIHRIIVVDDDRKALGVVTTTDVMAALAYADGGPEAAETLRTEMADSLIWATDSHGARPRAPSVTAAK